MSNTKYMFGIDIEDQLLEVLNPGNPEPGCYHYFSGISMQRRPGKYTCFHDGSVESWSFESIYAGGVVSIIIDGHIAVTGLLNEITTHKASDFTTLAFCLIEAGDGYELWFCQPNVEEY